MWLKLLFLLNLLTLSKSQLACNSIHNDFEITENETVIIQGSYEYFTQLAPDGRNILVIKPLVIIYNDDNFRIDIGYSLNFSDNQTNCNYTMVPDSICTIFKSTAAFVEIIIYTSNNTGFENFADALIIDGGNINRYSGDYIELKDKDNANVSAWQLNPPRHLNQISKCISYSALPEITAPQKKCDELISDTVIYNIQNNEEMLAAINVRYELNNYLTANVKIKWLTNYFDPNATLLVFELNDNLYNYDTLHQTIAIPYGNDQKTLLSFSINWDARLGSFSYRNGTVLMDESTPFSPENYCTEYSFTPQYYSQFLVSTTLCCSTFMDEYVEPTFNI